MSPERKANRFTDADTGAAETTDYPSPEKEDQQQDELGDQQSGGVAHSEVRGKIRPESSGCRDQERQSNGADDAQTAVTYVC